MPGDLFAADSNYAASIQSLALMAGVHRNRVGLWRAKGAPDTLHLQTWHDWFRRTGRSIHAARLGKIIAGGTIDTLGDSDAASDDQDSQETAATCTLSDTPESAAPAAGEGSADDTVYWEARAARARALRAELALDEDRRAAGLAARDLITAAECRQLVMRLASSVNDVIGRGMWQELLLAMPGVPDFAVTYLRKQHGIGIITMRERVTVAARECLQTLTKPKE